eukprot:858748-Pleurochrysis_carterae.AAC.1
MTECPQASFFELSLRRDRAKAVSIHALPSTPGADAVCVWSLSLEEAIIGALAQNLELPQEDDIIGRDERQVPKVRDESGQPVLLSQRRVGDNFGYPRHHYSPLSVNVLLAQLSRSREEVAMLLGESSMQNLPAQVELADPGGTLRFWLDSTVNFTDRVADEQLRVNLLPFPSVHFSDIHVRIRRHTRHDGRALDYGDPQWDTRTTFPFPDATWM